MAEPLLIGRGTSDACLLPRMANRHGLIAGATGTGKTVTLQVMAEQLSRIGVPVFLADVKGDLSGIGAAGQANARISERLEKLQLKEHPFEGCPVAFWDVFGEHGHPLRTTISEMGPLLLARLCGLNDTQSGLLTLVFKVADDQGLLLLDLKDLRAMLQHVGDNASDFSTSYGNVSKASIGAIQRALLELEQQGAESFFGEPALELTDLLQCNSQGRGMVNILAADRLVRAPKLYSTFLLWMLAELFERLPEVGDLDRPKLAFFFDEAHLLFADTEPALQEKVEQVVRLIRSKGVGVYFVSQSPLDIPDVVLGQLGNRVQHALRAFTPRDQKAVRAAAETFRASPDVDVVSAITELGVGEALLSMLDDQGRPSPVQRGFICPPRSQIGPLDAGLRAKVVAASPLEQRYRQAIDRSSAYELLRQRAEHSANASSPDAQRADAPSPELSDKQPTRKTASRSNREPDSPAEAMAKSMLRAAGSQLGRQLVRGVLGALFGGGRRR